MLQQLLLLWGSPLQSVSLLLESLLYLLLLLLLLSLLLLLLLQLSEMLLLPDVPLKR